MILIFEAADGWVHYINPDKADTICVYPEANEVVFSYGSEEDDYLIFNTAGSIDGTQITEETYNYIVAKLNQWAGV